MNTCVDLTMRYLPLWILESWALPQRIETRDGHLYSERASYLYSEHTNVSSISPTSSIRPTRTYAPLMPHSFTTDASLFHDWRLTLFLVYHMKFHSQDLSASFSAHDMCFGIPFLQVSPDFWNCGSRTLRVSPGFFCNVLFFSAHLLSIFTFIVKGKVMDACRACRVRVSALSHA